MQPLERPDTALAGFGDDLPRSIGIESVNHDAVVSEKGANLASALSKKSVEIWRHIEPPDHRLHHAGRIAALVLTGLCFDDDMCAGHVHGDIKVGVLDQFAGKQPLDCVGSAQHSDTVAQIVHGFRKQEFSQRIPNEVNRLRTDKSGNVGGRPRDQPVGRHGDQKTYWLNGPQLMDGFAVAVGQIDLYLIVHYLTFVEIKWRPTTHWPMRAAATIHFTEYCHAEPTTVVLGYCSLRHIALSYEPRLDRIPRELLVGAASASGSNAHCCVVYSRLRFATALCSNIMRWARTQCPSL